jgi:hypothetical protein
VVCNRILIGRSFIASFHAPTFPFHALTFVVPPLTFARHKTKASPPQNLKV